MTLVERMINLGILDKVDDNNVEFTNTFIDDVEKLLEPMVEKVGEEVFYVGAKSHDEASFNLVMACAEKVSLEKMGGAVKEYELVEMRNAIKNGFIYRMKQVGMDI